MPASDLALQATFMPTARDHTSRSVPLGGAMLTCRPRCQNRDCDIGEFLIECRS